MDLGNEKNNYEQAFNAQPVVGRITEPSSTTVSNFVTSAPSVDTPSARLTLSIPLPASAARGAEPGLQLGYSSAGGSSLFGFGWTIPFSEIGVWLTEGLPRYDGSDQYALDGGEPFLHELQGSGTSAVIWKETKTVAGVSYEITRYQPRLNPGLIRVEKFESQLDGVVHWRIYEGDGGVRVYGQSADARLADPENPRRIFKWLIERSYDVAGNCVRFTYVPEDTQNIVLTSAEADRISGRSPFANLHPKKVSYGALTPYDPATETLPEFAFHTVFDYGEHDLASPTIERTPGQSWLSRPDPFSDRRAGFEIRTYRLCRRVLHFHNFSDLGATPTLTRILSLNHSQIDNRSMLTTVTKQSAQRISSGYQIQSLPAQTFEYSAFSHAHNIANLQSASGENHKLRAGRLPPGTGIPVGANRVWADIMGTGLPGLIADDGGQLYYSENLGSGRFGQAGPLAVSPCSGRLGPNALTLEAIERDGRTALVLRTSEIQGYFRLKEDGTAEPFEVFDTVVRPAPDGRHTHILDSDGDGYSDILHLSDAGTVLARGRGRLGPSPFEEVQRSDSPRPVATGMTHAIRLADMTGDGQMDLVEVGANSLRYWPALGHGRFGRAVQMTSVPKISEVSSFDPSRIILASLLGSGPADLIYVAGDRIRYALNAHGNDFGELQDFAIDAGADPVRSAAVLDLLGDGIPTIVLSGGLGSTDATTRYVQPAGKLFPGLLTSVANGMGADAAITYTSSTLLAEKAAQEGRPWLGRLPYAVQCVTEIVRSDHLRNFTSTQRYAYAHGTIDPIEREFVGFARVDRWDSSLEDELAQAEQAANPFHQPTLHTISWFDAGFEANHTLSPQSLSQQWWNEEGLDGPYRPVPPPLPIGVDPVLAARARRGSGIRTERYALDGTSASEIPIDVSTGTLDVVTIQSATENQSAVLRTEAAERVTIRYERDSVSPGVNHTINLSRGSLGHSTLAASIAYGRRDFDPSLPLEVRTSQARTVITLAEREFTPDSEMSAPTRRFLRRRPWLRRSWSLEGQTAPSNGLFRAEDILLAFQTVPEIEYELPTGTAMAKRLLAESRDTYLDDDLASGLLPGALGNLPIVARRFSLALTPGIRSAAWPENFVDDAELLSIGYVDLDGDNRFWSPSGRAIRGSQSLDRFLLPDAIEDTMGIRIDIFYDSYALHTVRETDALGNTRVSEIDYRLGEPVRSTDVNGTVLELGFDIFGHVIARAVRGPNGEGDTLLDPTTTFSYDMKAFESGGTPNWQRSRVREDHANPNSRWIEKVHYFDGQGSVLQTRTMAAPGAADIVLSGSVAEVDTGAAPRWQVTSKPRLTNKGSVASKFDPFYSNTDAYSDDVLLTERGGQTIITLDAEGEKVRCDYPDGSFDYSTHDVWKSLSFDPNDTVLESTFYANAGAPDALQPAPASDDGHAAWVAAQHAGTATESYRDATGVVVYEIEPDGNGHRRSIRNERVPGGHRSFTFDSADRLVLSERADMLGQVLEHQTMEDGTVHCLYDAGGRRSRTRRPDGTSFEVLRDTLARPLGVRVTPADGGPVTVPSLTLYGEGHPEADQRFIRGKSIGILDSSGLTLFDRCDFKGQVIESSKRFIADASASPDWSGLINLTPDMIVAAAAPLLDTETFTNTTSFDALNRPVTNIAADGSQIDSVYDLGGNRVSVTFSGNATTAPQNILVDQTFDAFGAITRTIKGDGTQTDYVVNPATRRLSRQTTTRLSDGKSLLDAAYIYDPVGNVTTLNDHSAEDVFFDNAAVSAQQRFEYDALYQLTRSTGRELASISDSPWANVLGVSLPHANNLNAIRRYSRSFSYDSHGNLTQIHHQAGSTVWKRRFQYGAESNRVLAVSEPGDPDGVFSQSFSYDASGRLTAGAGLGPLTWSDQGSLSGADLGGGGTVTYINGAGGARVKKIITRQSGATEEWLYLGAVDIHRRRDANGNIIEERHTLKISEGGRLLARIETKIVDTANPVGVNLPLYRFRHTDLTGSISVETTQAGALIQYETYHPFGTTAYRSASSDSEVALSRYRYADRETDAESGLICMGHRYYARWLGRFISPDPAGPVEGANTYAYSGNNPIMRKDPSGLQSFTDHPDWPENLGQDATWADLQTAARIMGREISQDFNANNYQEAWSNSAWRILVPLDADAQVAEPGEPVGPGDSSEDSSEDPPANPRDGGDEQEAGEDNGESPPEANGNGPGGSEEGGGQGFLDWLTQEAREWWGSSSYGGSSVPASYSSNERAKYSKGNIKRAAEGVRLVESAIENGDEAAAWRAAEEASDARDAARRATQQRLRLAGGKRLSELIDKGREFSDTRSYYQSRQYGQMSTIDRLKWRLFTPGLPTHTPSTPQNTGTWQQATRNIAIGSGKTNRFVSSASKAGRILGPIGVVYGAYSGYAAVRDAAPEDKARVATGEVASFAAGAAGFALGSAATALLIGLAFSNPIGWVAMGATLLGGAIGAYLFSEGAKAGVNAAWSF